MIFSPKMAKNNLNIKRTKMNKKPIFGLLLAVISVAFMVTLVSAGDLIDSPFVEVDGILANLALTEPTTEGIAVTAGDTVPVEIEYTSKVDSEGPVVLTAWIQGAKSETKIEKTFNYDLKENRTYVLRFSVFIPADLDNDDVISDTLKLVIEIETEDDRDDVTVLLEAQRESNKLNILLVNVDSSVNIGSTVQFNVVVQNMGSREADDVFVTVSIPGLGVSKTVFYQDLFPFDDFEDSDGDKDREDSRERVIFLSIPANAQPGVYDVEVTAESDDTRVTRIVPLNVVGDLVQGKVLANPVSETFSVGETVTYDMILVNTGSNIAIYNIVPDASDALSISLSDTLITVPAGTSKTVQVSVKANREGTFNFAVNAISDDFSGTAVYSATVEGKSIDRGLGNNVVVLTVVLAIIFVVLLIILIVLLTRKPEKSEEFGESYY